MKVLDAHYSFRCLIHTISYTIGYLVQGQAGGREVPKPATNFRVVKHYLVLNPVDEHVLAHLRAYGRNGRCPQR